MGLTHRAALGGFVILLAFVVTQRIAHAASVSCNSSDGLPDFKTASDGSECETDGDGGLVKAEASEGGFAQAEGTGSGNATAVAKGNGSDATASASGANSIAIAKAKNADSSAEVEAEDGGTGTAISKSGGTTLVESLAPGAIAKASATHDGQADVGAGDC